MFNNLRHVARNGARVSLAAALTLAAVSLTPLTGSAAPLRAGSAPNSTALHPGGLDRAKAAKSAPLRGRHHSHALCGTAHGAQCDARVVDDVASGAAPAGYGPADLWSAYGIDPTAAGSLVAVIDSYDLPDAANQLAVYRTSFGLPPCTTASGCFSRVNQDEVAGSYPVADANWQQEEALDIEMVSAACPNCSILLVEANTNNTSDLAAAENTAVSLGAKYVTNSWGSNEFSGETAYDSAFNHPGVTITASSGDWGYWAEYPAASPYVTAVGGTTLTKDSSTRGWNESAWLDSGSGCSAYEPVPAWQAAIPIVSKACGAHRALADVSAVADPNTGVAVYIAGWEVVGGTSVSSPIVAAMYAVAGTASSNVSGSTPYMYGNSANLNDVVTGFNQWPVCYYGTICQAGPGWDGPTGLGTPIGVSAFKSLGDTSPPTAPVLSGSVANQNEIDLTWTASTDDTAVSGYLISRDGTLLSTVGASTTSWHDTTVTPGAAHTYVVTATDSAGFVSVPSNSVTLSSGAAMTSTSTALGASPASAMLGSQVKLTATVSPAAASGSVSFWNGSTPVGTAALSNGVASVTSTSLPAGSDAIDASYTGNSTDSPSTSPMAMVTITTRAPTTTVLTTSSATVIAGTTVTFTATVKTTLSKLPTGNATFFDGATSLGTSNLNPNAQATFKTANLAPGGHVITAAYNGDTVNAPDTSAPLTETVNSKTATTAVLFALNCTVITGQTVNLTAAVTSALSNVPTGSVTFYDGTTSLGNSNLNNTGVVTFNTSHLAIGTHSLTAAYKGDSLDASSTSAPLSVTVLPKTTTVALTTSNAAAAAGQTVTFTATVKSPQGGTPAGTVTFYDGTTVLATVTLNNGVAALKTAALLSGAHTVTAGYNGSAGYSASTSNALTETIA